MLLAGYQQEVTLHSWGLPTVPYGMALYTGSSQQAAASKPDKEQERIY